MDPDQVLFDDLELKDRMGTLVPRQQHMPPPPLNLNHLRQGGIISSIYIAEGLHPTGDLDQEELPPRFEIGSSKQKVKWFGALCVTGIGMFVEAYIIITTGQIKTVWHAAYPQCFIPEEEMVCPNLIGCCGLFPNTPDTCGAATLCNDDGFYQDELLCEPAVINSLSFVEFAGIMLGMLTFGKVADVFGKSFGGILAASFQVVGIVFMTFFKNVSINTQFIVFDVFFGVFGFGVGGEYPLTAASAAAHGVESKEDAQLDDEERHRVRVLREQARTLRRGETISLAFAMQGVGAVFGSVFLICMLYFGNQDNVQCEDEGHAPTGYDTDALRAVWRSFYFIGFIFVAMVLIYRSLILDEGNGHNKLLARKQRRAEKLGGRGASTFKLIKFYLPRLIGTGGAWFAWDIAFYGLKLFSGPIFNAINPQGNLVTNNGYLLINNLCALVGYYAAAWVIDIPSIGRKRLQITSFIICSVLFFVTGAIFNSSSPKVLMFLYFLSSFFGQLGPNVTTYVMAAETYPTELRATCHGISAFLGKAGALLATIVFSHMASPQIFFVCGCTGILGAFFTFFFSVDLTHVSLAEHDVQLELFLEGRIDEYKGKLNDTKHLSVYERITGKHGVYEKDWAKEFIENTLKKASAEQAENVQS